MPRDAECPRYVDHEWQAEPMQSDSARSVGKMSCRYCGVGHSFTIGVIGKMAETGITIFPANGSNVISRAVIRWSLETWENTIKRMELDGYKVVRKDPVMLGTPVGF